MLRYALFCGEKGEKYYPAGGWDDFVGTYETLEKAVAAGDSYLSEGYGRWFHVVDLSVGSVVFADDLL